MFKALRKWVFRAPDKAHPSTGAITLADVVKNRWFELWYQPKIDLHTQRLVGAEGLVRARHPERGVLNPGAFLPGATESDMRDLTERLIVMALRDWEQCAAQGVSVKFSVNTPVSALTSLPLAKMLREERPKSDNWPGLILEVTEDEIVHDLKLANDVADALREYNCTLAIDDFGAGYSSLVRLKQLPFSELKIDRSYVMNCHVDRVSAGLCEVIIELGHRFGLKTVAEGIERTHEWHKLQGLGCDIGQGYLFAKPMPKAKFIGMLRGRLMGRPEVESKPAGKAFVPKYS
jgi:EAL domain-containing protein (putative c-di-GMP-specific phosphodiesterase class I)